MMIAMKDFTKLIVTLVIALSFEVAIYPGDDLPGENKLTYLVVSPTEDEHSTGITKCVIVGYLTQEEYALHKQVRDQKTGNHDSETILLEIDQDQA